MASSSSTAILNTLSSSSSCSSKTLSGTAPHSPEVMIAFKKALQGKNADEAKILAKILEKIPSLLDYCEDTTRGGNLLHWMGGNYYCYSSEVLEVIYKHLQKTGKKSHWLEPDLNGSTPVHYITQYGHPDFLRRFIEIFIPPSLVCDALKIPNKIKKTSRGYRTYLPADTAELNKQHAEEMLDILEPYVTFTLLRPLDEQISAEEIKESVASYPTRFQEGMKLAYRLINHARDPAFFGVRSPSHPNCPQQDTITDKEYTDFCNYRKGFDTKWSQDNFRTIKKLNTGSCNEYARAVEYFFEEEKHSSPASVRPYKLTHGDHTIDIIDCNGEKIVCDAWGGVAFPLENAYGKLLTFSHFYNPYKGKDYLMVYPYDWDYSGTLHPEKIVDYIVPLPTSTTPRP
jgi:hypothetical protein